MEQKNKENGNKGSTNKQDKVAPPQFDIKQIENTLKGIEKTMAVFQRPQIIETLRKNLEFYTQWQMQFQKNLEPFLRTQKQIQEIVESTILPQKQLLESVFSAQKQFQDFIEQAIERKKAEREVMLKTGWFFTPSFLEKVPNKWIEEALDDYKKGKRNAITNLFKKIYHQNNYKNLKDAVKEWSKNPLFKPRMKVIEDALEAHCKKKYTLSIPSLLPVVEGIATDYCKKVKIYSKKDKTKSGKKIKKAIQKAKEKEKYLELLSPDILFSVIDGIIFKETDKLKREKSNYKNFLNRHMILHGIEKDYAAPKKSLQCFMLLDVLSLLK